LESNAKALSNIARKIENARFDLKHDQISRAKYQEEMDIFNDSVKKEIEKCLSIYQESIKDLMLIERSDISDLKGSEQQEEGIDLVAQTVLGLVRFPRLSEENAWDSFQRSIILT
jgi:Mg2+/Co2+ transporter CorC